MYAAIHEISPKGRLFLPAKSERAPDSDVLPVDPNFVLMLTVK